MTMCPGPSLPSLIPEVGLGGGVQMCGKGSGIWTIPGLHPSCQRIHGWEGPRHGSIPGPREDLAPFLLATAALSPRGLHIPLFDTPGSRYVLNTVDSFVQDSVPSPTQYPEHTLPALGRAGRQGLGQASMLHLAQYQASSTITQLLHSAHE